MTSIIKLTPFSGVDGESPPCYLLHVDEFRFLLDCGWDENFRMELIKNLRRHVHHLDGVLLTYADPFHLGALPYLVGKMGLKCPVYATVPVFRMGQMFMYDLHQSKNNSEEFTLFSLDDIDLAFERVRQLTYNEPVDVKGRIGTTLQITALPAGHMIGGTVWKIVKDGNEVIVYGVDYNHKKERHLSGCSLEHISRPHLFITDSYNADYVHSKRVSRDEQIFNTVSKTLRSDGNVLIAVDTAGRVLEIAHLLEQMWKNQDSGLMAYNLVLLNNVSYNVIEFAKSMLEWMSEKVTKTFELQRLNPFQFKHLQVCHSLFELSQISEPKVVLASMPDLDCGFSRELFVQWCGNPNNTVVLTCRTSPGTLARTLIDDPQCKSITLEMKRRVRLEGFELEEFRKKEKAQEMEKVMMFEAKKIKEEMESSSDSDSDDWEDANNMFKHTYDVIITNGLKRKCAPNFKPAKRACTMYPHKEIRTKHDEYGSIFDSKIFSTFDTPVYVEHKQNVQGISVSEDVEEFPLKCISTTETLDVLASIVYIDFEGRSDGESMKNIVSQIKPLQLIMVKGNKYTIDKFSEFARPHMPKNGRILVPKLYEPLDATMDSHIFQIKLTDRLVSSLSLYKVKDMEIAWVDALLDLMRSKPDTGAKQEDTGKNRSIMSGNKDVDDNDDDDDDDTIPTLDSMLPEKVPAHQAVFINNLKLSEFKQVLVKHSIKVEFCGGVLVCNNKIAVKKNETGQLYLEGTACQDYFTVRGLLYEELIKL